jgi:phosphoribosylglycinamide formyltransferase-1
MLSGSGRTLANLLGRIGRGDLPARVGVAIASRQCPGAQRARDANIPTLVMPGVIPAAELERALRAHGVELVALAGYLKLVDIPRAYEGRIANIHPALLPSFGGPGMHGRHVHEAVLASGARESGCTVHLVTAEYDRGPILLQRRCPVLPGDTPDTLAARVFAEECEAYPEAIRRWIAGEYSGRR